MLQVGSRFGLNEQIEVLGFDKSAGICMYKVQCHTCRKDQELHGLAIFETTKDRLEKHQFPCGCATIKKWTKSQYAILIQRKGTQNNCNLIDFADQIVSSTTKLSLQCYCKRIWSSCNVGTFLADKGPSCCPDCATSGFKRSLPAFFYVLNITGKDVAFTGYGITNYLNRRLATHKKNLAKYGLAIADKFCTEMSGQRALAIEQLVPYSFPTFSQIIPGFIKEATTAESFQPLQNFVLQKVAISGA